MMVPSAKDAARKPKPGGGDLAPLAQAGGFAKAVQKVVNGIRRCENRLRKIEEESEAAGAKWEAFKDKMKKSFVAERAKYYEDVGRLKAEKEEQTALQEETMAHLYAILMGNEDSGTTTPTDKTVEADKAWDELMVEADQNEDMSSLLNHALLGGPGQSGDARQNLLEILTRRQAAKATASEAATTAAAPDPNISRDIAAPRRLYLSKTATLSSSCARPSDYALSPSPRLRSLGFAPTLRKVRLRSSSTLQAKASSGLAKLLHTVAARCSTWRIWMLRYRLRPSIPILVGFWTARCPSRLRGEDDWLCWALPSTRGDDSSFKIAPSPAR